MASFITTAYGPPWNALEGGNSTSTGVNLDHQIPVIAVDPHVIPYGSIVKIPNNPFGNPNMLFVAADTGGAIVGNHIDFFVNSANHDNWGRQNSDVQVVQSGSGPGSVQGALAKVTSGQPVGQAGAAAPAAPSGAAPAQQGTPVPQVPQSLQAVGGALSAAAGPWNVSPKLAQAYANTTGGGAMGGSVPNLPAPPAARGGGVSGGRGPIGRLAAALVKPPK